MHPTAPRTTSSITSFHVRRPVRVALLLCFSICTQAPAQTPSSAFDGRWDLTVHAPGGDRPSWVEVHSHGSTAQISFVGPVGSAVALPPATIAHGVLAFSVPADDPAHSSQQYRATLHGQQLAGQIQQAGHPTLRWTGQRAPVLPSPATVHWGAPQPLFDGRTFAGWHFSATPHRNWTAVDGRLQSTGRGADLISDISTRDLQLHLEWRCSDKANSGVYLRGRYEVQIETDSAAEPPSHHTGGVYGFLAPHPEQPRIPGAWQSYDLELLGRTITVRQNNIVILDHQQIPGLTGGALNSNESAPGPIVLQGSEDGTVEFRNLQLRLPLDSAEPPTRP